MRDLNLSTAFETSRDDRIRLAEMLQTCKGKVALSGCRNDVMDMLYKNWRRFDAPLKQGHSIKRPRQEVPLGEFLTCCPGGSTGLRAQ
jgi:DNA adenine methylase